MKFWKKFWTENGFNSSWILKKFWIETILAMGDAQWDKVKPYSVQKKLERNKIHPFQIPKFDP